MQIDNSVGNTDHFIILRPTRSSAIADTVRVRSANPNRNSFH